MSNIEHNSIVFFNNLKRFYFISLFFLVSSYSFSQVGIGTTTPDASSVLDVTASDKGILIPRVSLANINTTMLDGINTAATGLLIYNTNASVIGGNGLGYYYFNGTIWEQLKSSSSISDHDFYEEGTTNSPNSINDDIFTHGHVAIGKSAADYALDVEEVSARRAINVNLNASSNADHSGIYIRAYGSGTGFKHGVYNDMSLGDGLKYGVRNELSGGGQVFNGVLNNMSGSGSGIYQGVNNFINASGSGEKFGCFTRNSSISQGDIYGVYSAVSGNTGLSFSGFFVGDFAIGTQGYNSLTPNHYILPPSRGTANQIMQTDATGNVNWVDATDLSDHDWHEEGTTNAPNDINADIFTLGNVAIGKNSADYSLDIEDDSNLVALNVAMTNTSNSNNISANFENLSSGTGEHYGVKTNVSGSDKVYGNYNNLISSGSNHEIYGTYNNLTGSGGNLATSYGLYNNFNDYPGGVCIGIQNEMPHSSADLKTGMLNNITNHSGLSNTKGIENNMVATSNNLLVTVEGTSNNVLGYDNIQVFGTKNIVDGTSAGNAYASYNLVDTQFLGSTYGVYSENLNVVDAYAGYFLGNISIGTTATNNYILPPSRGTANQIMQTDGSGIVSWVNETPIRNASNGLTVNTNDIVLGGSLTQATTITHGTNNLAFNLNNTGDFRIEGNSEPNLFYADGGNDRIGVLTNAPEFDIHLVQPNTFVAGSSGIGFSTGVNNWKIYHSGLHFSFVENGVRRAYVEGGTGNYIVTSDRRLKKSITEVESILEKVNHLNAFRYLYKDQDDSAKKIFGFMAQDVEPLFPELVGQAEDGYFALNYAGFGVVAIKAIQEQQDIIYAQQKQIDDLQKDKEETSLLLFDLLKRIENLESKNE